MHVIIALLCFAILLSISPTARWLTTIVVLIGVFAYALHCNEGGKSIPITTTVQASPSPDEASNERTKPCQTAKGQRCLNLQMVDRPSPVITHRASPSAKKVLVEHKYRASSPPQTAGQSYVNHNGSVMQILLSANQVVDIVYFQPRQGLWNYVTPGTALIHGQWRDRVLYATAYVFSHCGPTPYTVSGEAGEDDPTGSLVLMGPAPLVDPQTCQIIQWVWSDNSVLTFTPL